MGIENTAEIKVYERTTSIMRESGTSGGFTVPSVLIVEDSSILRYLLKETIQCDFPEAHVMEAENGVTCFR